MNEYSWATIPKEQLNPLFSRQVIHGDAMTVARVFLSKGCVVPEHSHPNEQLSMIEKGSLRFRFSGVEKIVRAGEMIRIPGGVPHSAEATEDCEGIDVFSPVREDWRSGNDAYLRK